VKNGFANDPLCHARENKREGNSCKRVRGGTIMSGSKKAHHIRKRMAGNKTFNEGSWRRIRERIGRQSTDCEEGEKEMIKAEA